MYPCRYKKETKVLKGFTSLIERIESRFDGFKSSFFSPAKLYMNGWITDEEYKNISKYNVVKLRLYNASSSPLIVRVALRILFKKVLGTVKKILFD